MTGKTGKQLLMIMCLVILLFISSSAFSIEQCTNATEEISLFYSTTCPHCKNEIAFLKELETKYPQIEINYLEVSANYEEFEHFAAKYNTTTGGVPRTFIGNQVFVGFSKEEGKLEYDNVHKAYIGYRNQIESAILKHSNINGNTLPTYSELSKIKVLWLLLLIPLYLFSYLFFIPKFKEHIYFRRYWLSGLFALIILIFFIIIVFIPETLIKDYAQTLPFPLFVTIIALADGFNPCAFTVLIILLSLLTYTKDKKSMIVLGLTFILTSAVMYFIFILTMIFVGSWALQQYGPMIMTMLGLAILFAGIINVKDFFFFKKGFSLSISDSNKLKFTHQAKRITDSIRETKSIKKFLFALGGTFLLAALVNIVELGCTAILPAVYMVSLVNTFGSTVGFPHIFWTILYSLIYILPLVAILFNFIYTFRSTRLTEKQGRILKLVAGLFMLLFGTLMIFRPELLMFG